MHFVFIHGVFMLYLNQLGDLKALLVTSVQDILNTLQAEIMAVHSMFSKTFHIHLFKGINTEMVKGP